MAASVTNWEKLIHRQTRQLVGMLLLLGLLSLVLVVFLYREGVPKRSRVTEFHLSSSAHFLAAAEKLLEAEDFARIEIDGSRLSDISESVRGDFDSYDGEQHYDRIVSEIDAGLALQTEFDQSQFADLARELEAGFDAFHSSHSSYFLEGEVPGDQFLPDNRRLVLLLEEYARGHIAANQKHDLAIADQRSDLFSLFVAVVGALAIAGFLIGKGRCKTIENAVNRRKKIERDLRLHKDIVSASREMIAVVDRHSIVLAANDRYCKFYGVTASEVIGKSLADVHGQEDFDRNIAAGIDAALKGEDSHFQALATADPDSLVSLDAVVSPCALPDSNDVGALLTIRDITETENLRRESAKTEKMQAVRQLVGGLMHDYNNMLSVILGNVELAKTECDQSSVLYEELSDIQKAAEQCTTLTQRLRIFGNTEDSILETVDLNSSVEKILVECRESLPGRIELVWNPAPQPCWVDVDPIQLEQIVTQLLGNAAESIDDGGKICFDTQVISSGRLTSEQVAGQGSLVRFSVSDDGCGMDEHTANNIFEPFFTTKEFGKSSGLGLSIVYGAVKGFGGTVDVSSKLGHGTRIDICLPLQAAKAQSRDEPREEHDTPDAGILILLVEDEPEVRNVTERFLQRSGYTVIAVESAEAAIRVASKRSGDIDLLLADVIMPNINGKELADRLLEMIPGLRVILMSGYTASTLAVNDLPEDALLIQKPFRQAELTRMIQQSLHG